MTDIEVKIPHHKHEGHISYDYVLRVCKHCGELYYNITDTYFVKHTGKTVTRNVYDHSAPLGNNPFITHLERQHS